MIFSGNIQVLLLSCLVAIASARPDHPPPSGYGYEAPAPSYSAPAPAYHAPEHEASQCSTIV